MRSFNKTNLFNMKKTIKFLVIAITAVGLFSACKKGENDPFLSLKSRTARITGEWKLTSSSSSSTYVYNGPIMNTSNTSSSSYDGTTMTETDNGSTSTYSYTMTLTIEKDGSYKVVEISNGSTSTYNGNWWWENSGKDKVRIAFDDDYGSFYIDKLKNKEMTLIQEESDSYNDLEDGTSGSSSYTMTMNFEKQ